MKILIVSKGNNGKASTFVKEQVDAIILLGHTVEYFFINRGGVFGYLLRLFPLIRKINQFKPDIIHAHYGLSGFLANLQRKIPVITTYHGSDINIPRILIFSKMSIRLSAYNIFVSQKNIDTAKCMDCMPELWARYRNTK